MDLVVTWVLDLEPAPDARLRRATSYVFLLPQVAWYHRLKLPGIADFLSSLLIAEESRDMETLLQMRPRDV